MPDPNRQGDAFDQNEGSSQTTVEPDNGGSGSAPQSPVARAQALTGKNQNVLDTQLERQEKHNREKEKKEERAGSESSGLSDEYQALVDDVEEATTWDFDLSTPASEFTDEELTHEADKGINNYMEAQSSAVNDLTTTVNRRSEMIAETQSEISDVEDKIDQVEDNVGDQVEGMDEGDKPEDMSWREFSSAEVDSGRAVYERELSELQEELSGYAERKQEAVSERSVRREEAQEVHSEYAEEVEDVVSENFGNIRDALKVLNELSAQQEQYNEDSVEASDEDPTLNQSQQDVVEDRQETGLAYVAAGLEAIDELEDAVADYESVADAIDDDLQIETRNMQGIYNALTDVGSIDNRDELPEDDQYNTEILRQRVKEAAEGIMDTQYDSIRELRDIAGEIYEEE